VRAYIYTVKGADREKVMDGVVRLVHHDDKVLIEGILGDSVEIAGQLSEVNITTQKADIIIS